MNTTSPPATLSSSSSVSFSSSSLIFLMFSSRVAILSAGNVAQGAFETMAKFNADIRMFYRKTMHEFYNTIDEYDIIVNGIEIDNCNDHILTLNHLKQIKSGCLVIDAAADAGNAIEGTHFASLGDPMYKLEKAYVYCVNNAPTLLYRDASKEISKSFAEIFDFFSSVSSHINQ